MNKSDLVAQVAEKGGLTNADAKVAVESVLDSISESLVSGDKVQLVGFGTFSLGHRAERKGRNPQTGAELTIAAKNTVKFKAGKELVNSVQ